MAGLRTISPLGPGSQAEDEESYCLFYPGGELYEDTRQLVDNCGSSQEQAKSPFLPLHMEMKNILSERASQGLSLG